MAPLAWASRAASSGNASKIQKVSAWVLTANQDNRSYFFVGECDSVGEQISDRVVLSIGRDDLGDEGIRQ